MPFQLEGGINFRYTNVEITQSINILPNTYGRVQRMGLFKSKPIRSVIAEIRRRHGKLKVLTSKERGAPPAATKNAEEDSVLVKVPHFPWTNSLGPEDVQDLFAHQPGPLQPKTVDEALNEILQDDRLRADQTLEFMRIGSLKGEIRDGSGEVKLNLFNAFGITKKTVYLDLDATGENQIDIIAKTTEITDYIEDNLKGEVMDEVRCFVDSATMTKIITHPSTKEYALSGGVQAMEVLRQAQLNNEKNGFVREYHINGVTFETYRGSMELEDGSSTKLIDSGTGHAFPVGTRDVFSDYLAPAHAMNAANQPGVQIWASAKPLDHDQGVEMSYQMNAMPLCARPELLVEVKAGADPS